MHRWRRLPIGRSLGALLVVSLLVGASTGGAATITGTAGNDTLRGSARADKLTGLGGNDKVYGLAGNDTLVGGGGNDLLVGGAGADRLSCGPGRDVANADAADKVGKDCEVVRGIARPTPRPPPPPPPPPPPAPPPPPPVTPITAGSYKGATQNGNFVFFTVAGDRTLTGFRVNDLPAPCNGGLTLSGGEDFGDNVFTITSDGGFTAEGRWDGSSVQGDLEWTHWDGRITGQFDTSTTMTGTISMNYELKYQGTPYRCSSGEVRWSAALQS